MSDNITEQGDVDIATTDSVVAQQETPVEGSSEDGDGATDRGERSREAAKYRTRLRDAEAARDTLSERLSTMQRREVERLAAGHLADAADIWRDGLELDTLLGEDGHLDSAKVVEAAKAVRKAHPHWAPPRPQRRNPAADGFRNGATGGDGLVHAPSWQSVLGWRD